jgi:Uncharacterized conserved protein (DUF2075)
VPGKEESSVFLTGNGPLVTVLREALARDEVGGAKQIGASLSKGEAKTKVNAFIQNIHHFRDEGITSDAHQLNTSLFLTRLSELGTRHTQKSS